jgi:quercetin dioxygenase-like cupin family protein
MNRFGLASVTVCVVGAFVVAGVWGAAAGAQVRAGADGQEFVRVTPDTVKWMEYAGDGAQFGIKQAYIYGDPSKPGLYIIRIMFPPGVMSTPHSHPETRIATVIKGTWWTGTGDAFDPKATVAVPTGGTMVHPAGKIHFDGAKGEETILEMMGIGPSGKKTAVAGAPGFTKIQ